MKSKNVVAQLLCVYSEISMRFRVLLVPSQKFAIDHLKIKDPSEHGGDFIRIIHLSSSLVRNFGGSFLLGLILLQLFSFCGGSPSSYVRHLYKAVQVHRMGL